MLANAATPFLRGARSRWGLAIEEAERAYPGDGLVARPRRCWTHAIEIDAGAREVWPWVAQMGQDRAGFYSNEWLEHLAGCNAKNSWAVVADWQILKVGQPFSLHPKVPPLSVAALEPGRWFVVTDTEPGTISPAHLSWLLMVEPLSHKSCRFISRVRTSPDRDAAQAYGPWLTESVASVMDRAMLRGVKRRAEGALKLTARYA